MRLVSSEKLKHRTAISRLKKMVDDMELNMSRNINPMMGLNAKAVRQITQSEDPLTQLAVLKALLDHATKTYMQLLKDDAVINYSSFCEFLVPEEPPAPHHEFLCDHLEAIERRDLMRVIISMPPGHAKDLALETPIATPSGWTTMGEINVGDYVFDETGIPTRVNYVSPIWKDRNVYKLTTDCGDEIIAGEGHEWLVRLCNKRPVFKLKTTQQLCKKRTKRPMISRSKALQLREIETSIDPYLLGYWLGDGTSLSGEITCHEDDQKWLRPELNRLGYLIVDRSANSRFGVSDIRKHLVSLGVLNNKHIPEQYLRAAYSQRLSLIQGMMDSDGTVHQQDGNCYFSNSNRELIDGFAELVRTMGVKAAISESRAILNNIDYGPCWRVSFYMEGSCRMPRKAIRTRNQKRTPDIYIDVEPAGIADTICIGVESESHLFLCGKNMIPTHNSTYSSHRFPAWYMGKHPNHKYIQAGHSQDFVENEFGKRVRGIIDSEDYREIFPDIKLSSDTKAAGLWALAKFQGKYLTRGVGQGIAGFRANIAAVDDPYATEEDAKSATIRKKVQAWFTSDLTTRLLPKSPLFIVATRWHPDDLCGVCEQDNKKGKGIPWTIINLPAIAEDNPNSPDPMGRAPGEPLWADFYDLSHLLNIKAVLAPSSWNALYCGRPTNEEGDVMKAEWFRRYTDLPKNEADAQGIVRTVIKRTTISVDTASKTNERNDYTAITVWVETFDGNHYLADVVRERLEYKPMEELIEATAKKWVADAILVEDKGSGIQYIQNRAGKAPAPVIPIKVSIESKQFRFDGVTPMFEAGNVFIPTNGLWVPDYERELLDFPNGSFDDQVDSTSQYLNWIKSRRPGGTKKLQGTGYGSRTHEDVEALAQEALRQKVGPSGRIGG